MYETVIINSNLRYTLGTMIERFERHSTEYARVTTCDGACSVVLARYVIPVRLFLHLVGKAEFEVCHDCHGTGKIDPVENPPYTCDACAGLGYFVACPHPADHRETYLAGHPMTATHDGGVQGGDYEEHQRCRLCGAELEPEPVEVGGDSVEF